MTSCGSQISRTASKRVYIRRRMLSAPNLANVATSQAIHPDTVLTTDGVTMSIRLRPLNVSGKRSGTETSATLRISDAGPALAMTSQGSAHGRFTRAIQQRNLWAAETSLRGLGTVSLEDALGYLDLLASRRPR